MGAVQQSIANAHAVGRTPEGEEHKKKRLLTSFTAQYLFVSFSVGARAEDLPSELKTLVSTTAASNADIATKNVLQLNETMFELYDNGLAIFRKNIVAHYPVILALFSGAGGRFILYLPGKEPLDAPSVPIAYQLVKSVGHSTMALTEVVGPFIDNPADQSWRGSMLAYRSRMQSALDGLDEAPLPADWEDTNRKILQKNIAFMDDCLKKGVSLIRHYSNLLKSRARC